MAHGENIFDGNKVKNRREALGINLESLSKKSGISIRTLHKMEHGELNEGRLETWNELASCLEINLEELLSDGVKLHKLPRYILPIEKEDVDVLSQVLEVYFQNPEEVPMYELDEAKRLQREVEETKLYYELLEDGRIEPLF